MKKILSLMTLIALVSLPSALFSFGPRVGWFERLRSLVSGSSTTTWDVPITDSSPLVSNNQPIDVPAEGVPTNVAPTIGSSSLMLNNQPTIAPAEVVPTESCMTYYKNQLYKQSAAAGSWIRKNQVVSLATVGGAAALAVLAGSRNARSVLKKGLAHGSKAIVASAPLFKNLLANKYVWAGAGFAAGGAALYAYRASIRNSVNRWKRDAVDQVVQDPEIQRGVKLMGQEFGRNIERGAVNAAKARLADGLKAAKNWLGVAAAGVTLAGVTLWQLYQNYARVIPCECLDCPDFLWMDWPPF
ncbi:MAG: hypothetical protein WD068_02795 [Candidatus Babeliales bacterium]